MRPRFISEEELKEMQKRVRGGVKGKSSCQSGQARASISSLDKTKVQHASSSSPYKYKGYRSKLEYNWANYLNGLIALGSIANFYYEPFNIRLPGKKNFYNPDFMVIAGDGMMFYEI